MTVLESVSSLLTWLAMLAGMRAKRGLFNEEIQGDMSRVLAVRKTIEICAK